MNTDASALSKQRRESDLQRMGSETFDVLIVGGGVTGTGAALDAVARGLSVALVEQRDYASGTSSRSSKLFHGGLRYLEQFNFALVREALAERNLMLRLVCPHLTKPVSFIYPLKHRVWERFYVGSGVLLYDMLARLADNPLPSPDHLFKSDLRELAPAIDLETTHGAVRYWDALVDDARHTMTLARTAASRGAALATSSRLVGLESSQGLVEARVVDLESDRTMTIRARSAVNATGVWTDEVQSLLGDDARDVKPSKGIHLVVPKDRIDSKTGMILRTKVSVLFVIPWDDHWIVGTTDTPWDLGLAHPAASRSDIDYLLEWVNTVLTTPLTHDDVVGVYAGLRPLLTGESEHTSKLSREHAVIDQGNGMVTVAGGKYTTYRVMAADAIDALAPYLGEIPASTTDRIPLIGADDYRAVEKSPPEALPSGQHQRLLGRYGSRINDLARAVEDDPGLAEPVVADAPYLKAEVLYAVTHEGALHLDDVLTRRTRLSIETRHRGIEAAPEVARIMGEVLGWDSADIERELHHYRARVEAEIDSQRQPDDRTADAARMGAPDVRTGPA